MESLCSLVKKHTIMLDLPLYHLLSLRVFCMLTVLGDFAASITAGYLLLESIVGGAAVARAWTSYFATLLNRLSNFLWIQNNLAEDSNLLDPIAAVVLSTATSIAKISTKTTSMVNRTASPMHILLILFVLVAGFIHADSSNLSRFSPHEAGGVFQATAVVYFANGGFDGIATMAEETRNPSRYTYWFTGFNVYNHVIYCLMALSLTMMQKYIEIDTNAAYTVAFQAVGMKWAKYLVALNGMTTALLVGSLGQARHMTSNARAHMMKTRTPIYVVTFLSAILAFFSSLDVLPNLLSISTLFIFMMMAIALLVRKYYAQGVTHPTNF